MHNLRLRFAALWLSQSARVLADWCLRMFVVLQVARSAEAGNAYAWHEVTAIFIAPFILLAPLNGAISNGLNKRCTTN